MTYDSVEKIQLRFFWILVVWLFSFCGKRHPCRKLDTPSFWPLFFCRWWLFLRLYIFLLLEARLFSRQPLCIYISLGADDLLILVIPGSHIEPSTQHGEASCFAVVDLRFLARFEYTVKEGLYPCTRCRASSFWLVFFTSCSGA